MDRMKDLVRIDLERVSTLRYECHGWVARPSGYGGGIIRFDGDYRPGSAGADDALFIGWKIGEFCDIDDPFKIQGLVVDFRGLNYEWGDNLSLFRARRLRAAGRPVLVVVRPESKDAFAGCLGEDDLRIDIEQATQEVDDFLRKLR
ncbi:hypothetical protein ACFVXH_15660 [Kitasatospora sp. NPDC058184]|uniref:hypothetical protein n=1 Tax=Kitasatospora sp. NPDC058184 TaxID=3346370 RepID=UPI0036DBFD55